MQLGELTAEEFATEVTILILIDWPLQYNFLGGKKMSYDVTILILIDWPLQCRVRKEDAPIPLGVTILILIDWPLQYHWNL